jgi:hypothetical protein
MATYRSRSFFFFWSIWYNESKSAEAFQDHTLLLVLSQILPGKVAAQEEMPLRTFFKPVWDSDPKIILSQVY